jgi:hypothetical protein
MERTSYMTVILRGRVAIVLDESLLIVKEAYKIDDGKRDKVERERERESIIKYVN